MMTISYAVDTHSGLLRPALFKETAHCDVRPGSDEINMIVIHNISLPPNEFGHSFVEDFFCGKLNPDLHPYFASIIHLRVSSHLFIKRDGEVLQFVPFHQRAWHAGVSSFQGQTNCNDFSIGIELEGTDALPYTQQQYDHLIAIIKTLMKAYPTITLDRIVGHVDIAPERKTDPGSAFDWERLKGKLV